MIERYQIPEVSEVFSLAHKYSIFLEYELSVMEKLGRISLAEKSQYLQSIKIDLNDIAMREKTTHHDVIAFIDSVSVQLKPEHRRYFHYGLTSSDVIDSALSVQLKTVLEIFIKDSSVFLQTLFVFSEKLKNVYGIGRSHGIYAEPLSWGKKFLTHYAEFSRVHQDYTSFLENDLTLQCSGAVGNFLFVSPDTEEAVASSFNLTAEPVSSQIIPRDRLLKLTQLGTRFAAALERLATELRLQQHSDLSEGAEGFSKGQKGSSTMPQKKNPISSENLCGMARVLKSHERIAVENSVLWHERDISHSSAERFYLPDHFGILVYSVRRLKNVISSWQINSANLEEKINSNPQIHSSYIFHWLMQECKMERDHAYDIVQKAAFEFFKTKNPESYFKHIEQGIDKTDKKPLPSLKKLLSVYSKHIEVVFKRVKDLYPVPELN